MNERGCAGELVLRERRRRLTDTETLALEAHLSVCPSCRALLAIGGDFEHHVTPERDDAARIQLLSRAAERWTRSGAAPRRRAWARPGRRRRLVFLLAACLALFGGVAAAALGTRGLLRGARGAARLAAAPAPEATPPAHGGRRGPSRAGDATADDDLGRSPSTESQALPLAEVSPDLLRSEAPTPAPEPARLLHAVRSARGPQPPAADGETASSLFHAANDARRAEDPRGATALFRRLERLYPDSAEAGLSRVVLGGLLLDGGEAKAALDEFERAARATGGAMRPEALYGQARAQAALRSSAAEKVTWRQLLQEFPTCPYAEIARRRLASEP
jgi:TolA-binding protein